MSLVEWICPIPVKAHDSGEGGTTAMTLKFGVAKNRMKASPGQVR